MIRTILTQEENDELDNHPIGSIKKDIGGTAQFELRVGIAKKMCQWFLDNDPELTVEMRAMYEKYPMWKFYCNLDMNRPRRMYGVADLEKSSVSMISAIFGMVYHSLDGVLTSDITSVDRWSEKHILVINTTKHAYMFFDPCAFLMIVEQFSQ